MKLFKPWFWMEVKYTIRKIKRFPKRLLDWSRIIFHDEDWDYQFFVDLVIFKLERMSKQIKKNDIIVEADKVSREINIVVEHFKRWQDIDKYVKTENYDIFWGRDTNGHNTLRNNRTKFGKFLDKRSESLKEWHWNEAWRKISRKGRNWWD